ncbi:pilus assembly protein TadG-related protein [Nocardioides sp. R-C-SC26]|uniref:pilus assembly protein TadG-related protein n=1 Tax=Nocardioides sp. R-C-SC26 TaxID=2870414 RepID=UPI001E29A622|nr:pilus assembly protein TadG-related protein [Nocardioides sp. R-C-SC26]
MRRRRRERGSAIPLILGFVLLLAMTVGVAVDASAAFLQRQGLASLADAAALHGADAGAQGRELYTTRLGRRPLALSADVARTGVRDYLARSGASREYPGLRVAVRVIDDEVVVELTAPLDLPIPVPGAPSAPRVSATSSALVDPE